MVNITDNGKVAEVNDEHELVVRAITEAEIEHASGKLGSAYTWDSGELNIDSGDTILFVQNTGTIPLILDRLIINGSNVICTWNVNIGTATTTATGTTVTGQNLNTGNFSDTADANAFSDETAVADGTTIMRVKTPITNTIVLAMVGIIIEKNHYIQINQETTSTSGSVLLTGHFENPS